MLDTVRLIFAAQLLVHIIFHGLEAYLERRKKNSRAKTAAKKKGVPANAANVITEESITVEQGYDEDFVTFYNLKQKVAKLSASSDFVNHARLSRKLIQAEKKWNVKMIDLSPEEKQKYLSVGKAPAPPNSAADDDDATSPAAKFGLSNYFMQAMNPNLSPEGRQDLYKTIISQPSSKSAVAMRSTQYIHLLKILCLWLAIHAVVGWLPKLSSLPIFTVPRQVLWPFATSKGPIFPLSLFWSNMSPESTGQYILAESQWTAGFPAFITLGLFGSNFVISKAIRWIRHEMFNSKGPFRSLMQKGSSMRNKIKV